MFRQTHHCSLCGSNVIDLVRVDEGFRKKCIDRVHIDQNDSVTSLFHRITYSRSVLGFSTQNVGLKGFDLRSRDTPYTLPVPPEFGWTTCSYCQDGVSVVVATSDSFISVWDLRMQLVVKLYRHSSGERIRSILSGDHMRTFSQEEQIASGMNVAVCVADEMSCADLTNGKMLLKCRTSHADGVGFQSFLEEVRLPPAPYRVSLRQNRGSSSMRRMVNIKNMTKSTSSSSCKMRSVLCPSGEFVVTGDTMGRIRYWDLRNVSQSYNVGEQRQSWYSRTRNTYVSDKQQERSNTGQIRPRDQYRGVVEPRSGHQDAVCDLAVITKPSKLLVSCGRDGLVKIWR